MKKILNQNGFTFLAALMIVVIMGIMYGLTGQFWKTIMKREREQELLFRGLQYRRAIAAWNTRPAVPGATPKVIPLNDLKDLLLDPSSLQKTKYLRQLYKDPMTVKGEWSIIRDKGGKGIIGVASTSNDVPLKNSFAEYSGLDTFVGKKKYSEWRFVFGADPGPVLPAGMPQ
jgi:type II secretory pathway pseudopilin PulG